MTEELSRYPLYINIVMTMIKYMYWLRLYQHTDMDNLLHETLAENNDMAYNNHSCWLSCIQSIFNEFIYNNPKSIKENNNLVAIKKEVPRIKI